MSDGQFENLLSFIFDNFEGARVVFLTRRFKEVSKSGWWRERSPKEVRRNVEITDARFDLARRRFPEKTLHLDYSEFKDKIDGFRRLVDWLGEDVTNEHLKSISSQKLMHLQQARKPVSFPQRAYRRVKKIIRNFVLRKND